MRLYVQGLNLETAPYALYPHPLNSAENPTFEIVCQACTTDPDEPVIVWHGGASQLGAIVGALVRHEKTEEHQNTRPDKK